jgi:cytochrome c peroxidase
MSLLNVAFFKRGLFWDGRSQTLEEQAIHPVEDPVEMNNTWVEVEKRLQAHSLYPALFRKAFGINNSKEITKDLAVKALAQFERTMVSSGLSKFDQIEQGLDVYTDQELLGRDLYFDENPDVPDAECGHCHNTPLGTSDDFFNNGLDAVNDLGSFVDPGKGKITGSITDNGKFRAPSLRNIIFSPPYMHDGRFVTLDEVIEHYNSGGKNSPNKDPLIRPLGLTEEHKEALKAFLLTMTEPDFNNRPTLQSPFQ